MQTVHELLKLIIHMEDGIAFIQLLAALLVDWLFKLKHDSRRSRQR